MTNPQAKLHIKADNTEDASLLLEATGLNYSKLEFGTSGNSIRALSSGNMEFSTASTFYFKDKNVGINNPKSFAPLHIGADWTFNLPERAGRTIAYNAYYPVGDPNPWRIKEAEASHIKFTDDGCILVETALLGLTGTLIEYDNALWIKEGKVGVKKEPSYELDVEGTTRTNHISAETGVIIDFTTEDLSCNVLTASVINTQNFVVDQTLSVPTIYNIENLVYEQLYVNTKITCQELEISASKWYDEVFEEDYKLLGIDELEAYVTKNHHLPSIPSEAEVLKNGIDVAEMNGLLLKKIEEMTLYIITLKKDMDNMKCEIENLKN